MGHTAETSYVKACQLQKPLYTLLATGRNCESTGLSDVDSAAECNGNAARFLGYDQVFQGSWNDPRKDRFGCYYVSDKGKVGFNSNMEMRRGKGAGKQAICRGRVCGVATLTSAGFDNGNMAEIVFNGSQIPMVESHPAKIYLRGMFAVVIDPVTQTIVSTDLYELQSPPRLWQLAVDLNSLQHGSVVLLALKDSGMERLTASVKAALRSVGSTISQGRWRQGYALIGNKGGSAMAEVQGGNVSISAPINCSQMQPRNPPPTMSPRTAETTPPGIG